MTDRKKPNPWDAFEWWPVWDPVPRKPWRLVNEKGETKRDEDGKAMRFHDAYGAERHRDNKKRRPNEQRNNGS